MGADLYRKSHHDAINNRYAELAGSPNSYDDPQLQALYTEGHPLYFRDSYNASSLFWKLDLSWWGNLDGYITAVPATESDGEAYTETFLMPDGARGLRDEVKQRAELLAYNIRNESEDDRTYFLEKFDRFLDFLNQAIEANDPIYCSV